MPDRPRAYGATDALLVLMAGIWGVNYVAVKFAGRALTPLTFTCLRVTIAAITVLAVVKLQGEKWPARRDVLKLLALGVVGNGLYQMLFVVGVANTRVADASLMVAAAPAFIAAISAVLGMERVSFRSVLGIAISIAGVGAVVIGSTRSAAHSSLFGLSIMFISVICWAAYTVLLKPITSRVGSIQINAITLAGGSALLILLAPLTFNVAAVRTAPALVWGALGYSAVISLGLAYLFWYRGIRVLGPTRTSAYSNLQPVVATLVAWAAFGELPTVWQLLGAVTIVGGVWIAQT